MSAVGVALVIPAVLIAAALTVGVGGGGLGGLGAFAQAFTGPAEPDAPLAEPARDGGRLLARARTAPPPGRAAPAGPGTGSGPGARRPATGRRPGTPTAPPTAPVQSAPAAPPATAPATAPAPAPTTAPDRGPVQTLTDPVTQVTEQVPVVGAGGPVPQIVDDAAKAVDDLVP